jgi:hypothetical protein
LIPAWLATLMDWHVWPSSSPWAVSPRARTVCAHIDYELVWTQHPGLFTRREQVGPPSPDALWAARRELAERDATLVLDVQAERYDGELALAVYGAGVVGQLDDDAWQAVAPLLTTCTAAVYEPRVELPAGMLPLRPALPPTASGRRPVPVRPESWVRSDVVHTWWSYPLHGTLRPNCACPAHTPQAAEQRWGPQTAAAPSTTA